MNTTQIEKLNSTNYDCWKILIKSILVQNDLWGVVSGSVVRIDTNKEKYDILDQKALAVIILNVKTSLLLHIKNCKTAAECWKKLEALFQHKGPGRKVTLFKKLIHARALDNQNMSEHIDLFTEYVEKLSELEISIQDEVLSIILLCSLPSSYESFVVAIESRDSLPIFEALKSKILEEELRQQNKDIHSENADTVNNALITKGTKYGKNKSKSKIKCYKCHKMGHYKSECKVKTNGTKMNNDSSLTCFVANQCTSEEWIIDSGATSHMTNNSTWMKNIKEDTVENVTIANNSKMEVGISGDVEVMLKNGKQRKNVIIRDVLHVPKLCTNLLSVSSLVNKGLTVKFDSSGCTIKNDIGGLIAAGSLENGMFKLNQAKSNAMSITTKNYSESKLWHRRFGHVGRTKFTKIKDIFPDVIKCDNLDKDELCVICEKGKQSKKPFKRSDTRSSNVLELVHSDVCGPMNVDSFGGSKFFLTFIDDYSHKSFVFMIKQKSEVFEKFKEFKSLAETQTGRKIKILRTDGGSEYIGKEFIKLFKRSGIMHQTTTAYTPQQNGVAERLNRTLAEKARCMLIDANLSVKFWAEAINTAAYIINRIPCRSTAENKTPEELWSGIRPRISHLKVFGCQVMVHIPKQKRKKFDAKSNECIMVGYSDTSKAYRVFDPVTEKVIVSRDVTFIENKVISYHNNSKINDNTITGDEIFNVINIGSKTRESEEVENDSVHSSEDEAETFLDVNDATYIPSSGEESSVSDSRTITETPHTSDATNAQDEPVSIRRSKRTIRAPQPFEFGHIAMNATSDPTSITEVDSLSDADEWHKAMKKEIESHIINNTWDLVELPAGKKSIKSKWVFKRKTDEKENVKYKARLVAKGCSQKYGVDYDETFSPVVRYTSIRYLFALAVEKEYKVHQMDVVTAFLQGDLDEVIYMNQPESYEDGSNRVCKLNKSVYGLKQAGRQWNIKLDHALRKYGLQRSKVDPCIYFSIDRSIIIAIYVDDFLIFYQTMSTLSALKTFLHTTFQMKDLGLAKNCLGMKINQKDEYIELDQSSYIDDVLEKFGMKDCKPSKTPSDSNQKLSTSMVNQENSLVGKVPYQEAVGSLLYLTQSTRPDLAFAVNDVSRFNSNHGPAHWQAVKRIFRYLKYTKDMKLRYSKVEHNKIEAFSDADWGSDLDKRRSCTGSVVKLSNAAISWISKRQPIVALSTTEAEYIALSSTVREILWIKQLNEELRKSVEKPIVIFCDNQSTIKLSKLDAYRPRSKHIDIRYHHIREIVENEVIDIQYINTENNTADILTKAVNINKQADLTKKLGLVN